MPTITRPKHPASAPTTPVSQHARPLVGKRLRWVAAALPLALVACGGGGDSTSTTTTPASTTTCAPFTDSFGRSVTCDEMRQLPGAIWGFVDTSSDASTGAGDAAADGTVADVGPVANALVEFKDQKNRIVRATTDANGYYRISLRGLTPPLTASVLTYYQQWKSMMVSTLVRAPANRKFYTINLTGLTHALATEVAKKSGLTSADLLQPTHVAGQKDALPSLTNALNGTIARPLALAGLGTTFDPLSTPFRADGQSAYDRVLRSITLTRTSEGIPFASISPTGAYYAKGCALVSFTGVPAQGGGYATMSMTSDGGFCGLYLSADPEGKVPASGGKLLTQPVMGTVVFDQGNRMSYTPLYGNSGTEVFSYEMSAQLNGETVPLVVQMTMNVTAPTATK